MLRKIISYILYGVSIVAILLASGLPQVANWWELAKPYFAVWFFATAAALCLTYVDQIRRITYPLFVCISAWAYAHKIVITKFTRNTHRVYKMQNMSYRRLFEYTQNIFDLYLSALNK